MKLSIEEVQALDTIRTRAKGRSRHFRNLATDSRGLKAESLFFALEGPHFDGHDFISQAWRQGAAGAVVKKGRRVATRRGRWLFSVADPLQTLGDAACSWRQHFDIPIIAITGSNGKTTTKEMLSKMLEQHFRVLKTEGNFNNLIGLPLTLNRLNRRHDIAVLEMGMSARGEISRLCEIARPDVAVITNIARAHLQDLGSLDAVAEAKGEILPHLPKNGLAVLNADDKRVSGLAKYTQAPIVRYGFNARADIRAHHYKSDPADGCRFEVSGLGRRFKIRLNLPGRHNASNALAAIAVASHYGISTRRIAAALRSVRLPQGRLQRLRIAGASVLNDAYNANPDSVLQSLQVLHSYPSKQRKIAVLGDMLELGSVSRRAHREIGEAATKSGIQELLAVGTWAPALAEGAKRAGLQANHIHVCDDTEHAARTLKSLIRSGDVILLKASRGMKLEQIIEYMKDKRGV